jgi:hypothetical protein
LEVIARDLGSPTFQQARKLYVAKRGAFQYKAGAFSRYVENVDARFAGTIFVEPTHVAKMAKVLGSEGLAVQGILIHEMGHYVYVEQNNATHPQPGNSVAAALQWCLMREAQASLFAYRVAKELKAKGKPGFVIAPTHGVDIYDLMADGEKHGRNLFTIARDVYASDTEYTLFCRTHMTKIVQAIPRIQIRGKRPHR